MNQVMKTSVQIFSHPQFGDIRIAGTFVEPLFCLVDVCNVLEIKNPSRAKVSLKVAGVHQMKVTTTLKNQHGDTGKQHHVNFTFISEQNFYKLIMRSNKPQAEPFQDWVCGEVLPAIRKDGGYRLNTKIGELEATVASQKVLLNETCSVVAKQEKDMDHLFSDAVYAIDVLRSISCYTTTQIAKEMGLTAQELNRWLCVQHVQYYQSGQYMLYADYAHCGYGKSRTSQVEICLDKDEEEKYLENPLQYDGYPPLTTLTRTHLVWTEKGRKFIHELYKAHGQKIDI